MKAKKAQAKKPTPRVYCLWEIRASNRLRATLLEIYADYGEACQAQLKLEAKVPPEDRPVFDVCGIVSGVDYIVSERYGL